MSLLARISGLATIATVSAASTAPTAAPTVSFTTQDSIIAYTFLLAVLCCIIYCSCPKNQPSRQLAPTNNTEWFLNHHTGASTNTQKPLLDNNRSNPLDTPQAV